MTSPDGTMTADIVIQSDWRVGYCASVTVKNTGSSQTTAWGLVLGLNGSTINHAWNARLTPQDGQVRAINEAYNGTLQPGGSTMWGFCGSGDGRPTVVSVDGTGGPVVTTSTSSVSSGAGGEGGAPGTGGAGGAGGEGGGTTTAGTGGEGGGTTTTTTTTGGTGGEGGGTTTTTTTGAGGEGGAPGTGGGTTTAGTGGEGGAPGTGGGTTTAGTGGEGGGTTTTTTTGTGSGGAPPGDPACGPDVAAFADVEPILTRRCANEFCHGSPDAPSAGLDLRASMAVVELVGQETVACSGDRALVVPFMPSSSYIMNKLKNVDLCSASESKMPPGTPLAEAEIKTITDWICAGAPDQ
ncbi:cellulose binding domain-containing protein [Sorangium cellulosum]|uniref:cellulose binding domain-containing protein n=1 Tax=Sorangium cellulosum TaxID=56 RepID=UPI0013314D14|nr:cellulose binding domain-containing protein [Sorangium cellulosum]